METLIEFIKKFVEALGRDEVIITLLCVCIIYAVSFIQSEREHRKRMREINKKRHYD